MLEKTDKDLEARLDDNQYDESQLISFKVEITRLSYYNPSNEWERVDGSIEIENVYYKYVKRRVFNDSLEVLCIPNATAMKLQAMKRQGSHPGAGKIAAPEPYVFTERFAVAPAAFILLSPAYYYSVYIPSHPRYTDERPPAFPA